jgi:hypothetical protein
MSRRTPLSKGQNNPHVVNDQQVMTLDTRTLSKSKHEGIQGSTRLKHSDMLAEAPRPRRDNIPIDPEELRVMRQERHIDMNTPIETHTIISIIMRDLIQSLLPPTPIKTMLGPKTPTFLNSDGFTNFMHGGLATDDPLTIQGGVRAMNHVTHFQRKICIQER